MSIMIALLLGLLQLRWLVVSSEVPRIAKPHCDHLCGNVEIPYPFGIGANCSYSASYEINCNHSFHPHKPFLHQFNLEVTDINWPGRYSPRELQRIRDCIMNEHRLTVLTQARSICASESNGSVGAAIVDFRGSPFRFSTWFNVFMVENNCGHSVLLRNRMREIVAGCASVCTNESGVTKLNSTHCLGVGCCQASLLPSPTGDFIKKEAGLDFYEIAMDHEKPTASYTNTCSLAAALVERNQVTKLAGRLPTVLEWSVALPWTVSTQNSNQDNFSCSTEDGTQKCSCRFPYEGNPYLPDGCQVVRECRRCKHHCESDFVEERGFRFYCENPWLQLGSILGKYFQTSFLLLGLTKFSFYSCPLQLLNKQYC
ncbi:hypothetical protein Cgig2_011841 [Carnegiea gigantea]|uniref:Wall-associated receptor kinase galacturonan-binding domain-containing protein n=1 Tax=Carnegiea gigantea TaxID=171969 RepID=A0A9Q1GS11_9CARY|nr:hypothetical protein Cgig2_011841 [Carnegiea gigantea]